MFGSLLRWPSRPSVLATMALGLAVPAGLLASAMPAMAAPHFTISQLVAPPGAASNLAVVSTSSTTEEVFYVPQNGSVQEKYFSELVGWNSVQVAPPGSASQFADIAAVTRDRNSVAQKIDLFWIGPNGSVEHSYFQDGLGWLRPPSVAPAGSASTSGSLAAVSRDDLTWEVFWVGPTGDVDDGYYYDGGPQGRFVLAPHSASTPNVSLPRHIAVVSRASNTMEVFWIGEDGSIQDRFFYDGPGWSGFTLAPAGQALGVGSPAGAISAVSRASNTMVVCWTDGTTRSRKTTGSLAVPGIGSRSRARTAWKRRSQPSRHLRARWTCFWQGDGTGALQLGFFAPPWSQTPATPAGPPSLGNIAAVSRAPSHLDAFYLTFNGGIDEATSEGPSVRSAPVGGAWPPAGSSIEQLPVLRRVPLDLRAAIRRFPEPPFAFSSLSVRI